MDNLLEPLVFDDTTIFRFIHEYRCGICGLTLAIKNAPGYHKYHAECVDHGLIIHGGAVHKSVVEKIESDANLNQANDRVREIQNKEKTAESMRLIDIPFSDEQIENIKKLVSEGRIAESQKIILEALVGIGKGV